MVLDGDRLILPLKQPFQTLAMFHKSQNWLPVPEILLTKYYRIIREVALEVELASSYLGMSAEFSGRVKPLMAGLSQ